MIRIFISILLFTATARAQLRIVQYNIGEARSGLSTVLQNIGIENVNGIARPIDILLTQEQEVDGNSNTPADIVNVLNGIYGANTYQAAPYVGTSSGGGLPGLIYRTGSVQLIGTPIGVGTVNTSANARQTIRYKLGLTGYSESADFYIYNSHFKANPEDANRRNVEAASNRANAAALASALDAEQHIIYAGDFNLYSGNEAAYATLTNAGSGQAIDVSGAPLDWTGAANKRYHTQSPVTSPKYTGQVSGGMNDRFDFQLVTALMHDGEGLSILPASYHVFGNSGDHNLSGAINVSNEWAPAGIPAASRATILNALTTATDHIPVVADYQLPAKMSVGVSAIPARAITGATVSVNVSVSNSAQVVHASGADELDYAISGVAGAASGTANALAAANNHALAIDTGTVGQVAGAINVAATSQSAGNASFSQNVSLAVVAHAAPSFLAESELLTRTIDLGVISRNAPVVTIPFEIFNRAVQPAAALDLDAIDTTGDSGVLSANLASGQFLSFVASLTTATPGQFATTYTIATSDENIPGATALAELTLNLVARVAIPGDANLDDIVNFADFQILEKHFGASGTWTSGDFTRDGLVDHADFAALFAHYGESYSPMGAMVPEPAHGAVLVLSLLLLRRR